jgi:hypothetical protein
MSRPLRAAVALALVVRTVLLVLSYGTNDMEAWYTFAAALSTRPLCDVYQHVVGMFGQFNHPPLIATVEGWLWPLARALHLPFYVAFKALPFVADLVTAWLLFRIHAAREPRRGLLAAALYLWNLDAILVATVHGNTDALCVAAAFSAIFLAQERQAWFWGGLLLAVAGNVKLIPAMLLPAFVLACPSGPALLRLAAGGAVGALPFVPALLSCRAIFTDKVLSYTPHLDRWGLPFLWSNVLPRPSLLAWFLLHAKPLLWGALLVGAVLGRLARRAPIEQATLAFALFLLLTPGFGVQYTLYLAPFLLATNLWLGAVYGLLAGGFLAVSYAHFARFSPLPVRIHLFGQLPMTAAWVGFAAWLWVALVVAWLCARIARALGRPGPLARDATLSR